MPEFFGKTLLRIVGRDWSPAVARDIEEAVRAIHESVIQTQQSPANPTRVQAGVTASPGLSNIPSLQDHIHDVETAAPGSPTGETAAEGSGTALMRASAVIKQGIVTTKGDILSHNGSTAARRSGGVLGQVLVFDPAETTGLKWEDGQDAVLETIAESERLDDYHLYEATSARYALSVFVSKNFR